MSKNIKTRLRERVNNNLYQKYLSKLEKIFNNNPNQQYISKLEKLFNNGMISEDEFFNNLKVVENENISKETKEHIQKIKIEYKGKEQVENVITIKDYKLYERCLEKNLNREIIDKTKCIELLENILNKNISTDVYQEVNNKLNKLKEEDSYERY